MLSAAMPAFLTEMLGAAGIRNQSVDERCILALVKALVAIVDGSRDLALAQELEIFPLDAAELHHAIEALIRMG